MRCVSRLLTVFAVSALVAATIHAQQGKTAFDLGDTPSVTGYEQAIIASIDRQLRPLSPRTDNLGNLYVTFGSGSPHRLVVTSVDQPGYVVSKITDDGFLRVQRLPQAPPSPVFDTLQFAQPVLVVTRSGKQVNGVFAGLSVHLEPGRPDIPKMNHPEELYVDIGAHTAAQVRATGVDLLDPIALAVRTLPVGSTGVSGPSVGDTFGAQVLLALLRQGKPAAAPGTTTVAFVTQQWAGGRGLNRLLTEIHPDELLFVGRIVPDVAPGAAAGSKPLPGSGVLLGTAGNSKEDSSRFVDGLAQLANSSGVSIQKVDAKPPRIASYTAPAALPARLAEVGVPTLWPTMPGESLSIDDLNGAARLLAAYLGVPPVEITQPPLPAPKISSGVIQSLIQTYGASGHEGLVREQVKKLLPPWAEPTVDSAGNLVLHLGAAHPLPKTRSIVFVAHMDEIGYQVKSIDPDGSIIVQVLGGGYTEYFLGHPVLLHLSDGSLLGGVLEPPSGWEQPKFEWPRSFRAMDEPARLYVGASSKEATEKLGIKPGDWMTIPKDYRQMIGTRASGRSFDDRVGCAALVEAVRSLGPQLPGRDVTFIWSTEEELGLNGAAAAASRLAEAGEAPYFVFAIDTFVSSDSPLESKRFADAVVGKGFVVRAIDNSNITRRDYVDRVVKLARANSIAVQYGVTGGGNDGSVFPRFGTVDIPLGWPLRYSHSPGEVIDTQDLDALSRIVTVLARQW